MDWLALTTLSVISRAVYGVLTKVLSNQLKVSAYTQATLLSLSGGLISLAVSPLVGGLKFSLAGASITAIILMVLGQGLGNIVYFKAMKSLTSGTAQIAFSSILVFNTVLSLIFLNLHLSLINGFGLVLLMLSILSVTNGKVEFDKKGVSLMVLAAFLFSVFQLSSADLAKHISAAAYLSMAYFGAALVVFMLKTKPIIKDLQKAPKKTTLSIPLITAIPSLGNFIFAYYAYRNAPQPAKVAMLLTAQVVLTVFLSYFFLKEKEHMPRKVAAGALVVVSAALIKHS